MSSAENSYLLILAMTLVTYATRVGGHVVLSRFSTIPARLSAALEAVPIAVLTALIAPGIFSGVPELVAGIAVVAAAYRLPAVGVIVVGALAAALLRAAGL